MRTAQSARRNIRRILRWITVAVLGMMAVVIAVAIWVGGQLVAPAPSVVGAPPADLPAETVSIPKPSGGALSGWFLSGDEDKGTLVLLHPLRGSRLSMVDRARMFYRAGYSVLLVDFQAHGESPGRHITAGYLESADASLAVEYARSRRPHHPIGVDGVSLGGAAALLASPLRVDAMVLESVYPTIDEAVENRVRMHLGPFSPIASWLLLVQLQPRLGIFASELRPIDHIGQVDCPLLIMSGSLDRRTTREETERLFRSAADPKQLVVVERAAHVDLERFAPELYAESVLPFFDQYLQAESDAVAAAR